jgi:acylpyruvate hydrolase
MKLATLYGPDRATSALHVSVAGGYVAVDALAEAHGHPGLTGLADVGELLRRDRLDELLELSPGEIEPVPTGDAVLAPPVLRPGKIVCVGLNYAAHIERSGLERPEHLVLFAKFPSCVVASGEPVVVPSITDRLDYEGELAVIIGRRARRVTAADALEHVGALTLINDVSARQFQRSEPQWLRAKSLDTFAPLGPVAVDPGSLGPIEQLRLRTRVNGELRQDALCAQMLVGVAELIEYISQAITLEVGDVIATGTPSGVAAEMDEPVWLRDGDLVEVEIEGIGVLASPIVAEAG